VKRQVLIDLLLHYLEIEKHDALADFDFLIEYGLSIFLYLLRITARIGGYPIEHGRSDHHGTLAFGDQSFDLLR